MIRIFSESELTSKKDQLSKLNKQRLELQNKLSESDGSNLRLEKRLELLEAKRQYIMKVIPIIERYNRLIK